MTTPPPTTTGRPRLWTSVAAVSVLLGLVIALVLVVSPAARRQVSLSTSRHSQPFVELFFVDQNEARSCRRSGEHTDVQIAVRSQLAAAAPVTWKVAIESDGRDVQDRTGRLPTQPGLTSAESVRLGVPRHAGYAVRVTLPGRSENLLVHCGAST